jgi:LCP family protein required for cell wall assembly
VTDRFQEPERSSAGDPRRVFIPAPSPPGGAAGRGADAPPRPRRPAGDGGTGTRAPGDPRGAGRDPRQLRVGEPGRGPDGPGGPDPGGPRGPGDRPPGGGSRPPRVPRPRLRRPRLRRVLAVVVVLVLLAVFGSFMYARSIFNRIEKVDVSDSLTSASHGTNYLIVGSDSRENVTQQGDAGFNGSEAPGGKRSDTIMVLHLERGKVKMLSIPRDLYVPIAGTDKQQKINAAYNGGPTQLVDTVTQSLGIPIDRYMEVDFVSFAGLVDGLGGVTIDFPNPVVDEESGLSIPTAGPVELDGDMALAYVRSRHYTETINGEQVEDPRADLGRIVRQQQFLSVVFDKLSKTKNPFALARAASGMAGGLRIDDQMSLFDALRLGWGMRGIDPEPLALPVDPDRNSSGAVLILREDEAKPILDQVR